jgi:hypothetical protein
LGRRHPKSRSRGRKGMAAEIVLRLLDNCRHRGMRRSAKKTIHATMRFSFLGPIALPSCSSGRTRCVRARTYIPHDTYPYPTPSSVRGSAEHRQEKLT